MHRNLFLPQAWRAIVADGDRGWIDREIASGLQRPRAPFSGIDLALYRLRAAGANDADVTEVARGMQASLLFSLAYLLSDPALEDSDLKQAGLGELGWALVETDANGEPTAQQMSNLHESVLGTDPTGREMRPR